MPRYVDAEKVSKLFDEQYKKTREFIRMGSRHLDKLAEGFTEAYFVILDMPPEDVAAVVHATWEWYNDETGWIDWKGPASEDKSGWRCSNCKTKLEHMFGHMWKDEEENPPKINFCPNCGAKMDKKGD